VDDLEQLSREDLIHLVRLQAQVITELNQQITELKQEIQTLRDLLQDRGPGNGLPPFIKANRVKREPKEKKERKKRTQAFTRRREEPTREIPHAIDFCPDCGHKLTGGCEHSRRQVIEIPDSPVEIIDHILIRRYCGICRTYHIPKLGPEDGVFGQHRFGPRLLGLVATLCTDYRQPRESVQRLLQSVYGVHLSVGGISEILHTVAEHGKEVVASILDEIRHAPYVHADETGFREDGVNGYLWSFSTPTSRYFFRDKSRGALIPKGILLGQWQEADGSIRQEYCDPFTGILICDFYAGYSWYTGPIQRCWDHFCRELKDLLKNHPQDKSVIRWVDRVFKVYKRAKKVAARSYPEKKRREWRRHFEAELRAIAKPYLQDEDAPQHKLAARIERFQSELFVFVQYAGLPSGNNPAERAIRPTVIARKISGGTRSAKGSATMSSLRTLFGTWILRGRDTLQASIDLLTDPHPTTLAAPT
jgi:transposase